MNCILADNRRSRYHPDTRSCDSSDGGTARGSLASEFFSRPVPFDGVLPGFKKRVPWRWSWRSLQSANPNKTPKCVMLLSVRPFEHRSRWLCRGEIELVRTIQCD